MLCWFVAAARTEFRSLDFQNTALGSLRETYQGKDMATIAWYTTTNITSNPSVFPFTSNYEAQIIDFPWLPYYLLGIYIFLTIVFLIFILFLQNFVALTSFISLSTCLLCLRIQLQIYLPPTPPSHPAPGSVYCTSIEYLVTEVDKSHFLSWGSYFQIESGT